MDNKGTGVPNRLSTVKDWKTAGKVVIDIEGTAGTFYNAQWRLVVGVYDANITPAVLLFTDEHCSKGAMRLFHTDQEDGTTYTYEDIKVKTIGSVLVPVGFQLIHFKDNLQMRVIDQDSKSNKTDSI